MTQIQNAAVTSSNIQVQWYHS